MSFKNAGIKKFLISLIAARQLPSPFTQDDARKAAKQFFPDAADPKQPHVVAGPLNIMASRGQLRVVGVSPRKYDYVTDIEGRKQSKARVAPMIESDDETINGALKALVALEAMVRKHETFAKRLSQAGIVFKD
jgi:hypothetical protein